MALGRDMLGRQATSLLAVAMLLAGACASSATTTTTASTTTTTTASTTTTTTATTTTAPTTRAAPVPDPPSTVAPTTTVAAVPVAAFSGTVSAVTAGDLSSSWRPGCPVAPDDLRLLRVSHWGFDDQVHQGAIVVAASVVEAVLQVFHTLYEQHFPIRRMEPVDAYGGDDDASMAAGNTSGFNCRPAVSDDDPHWSNHAYGLAIDVNPIENPYLLGGRVLPPAGADYLDRSVHRPGMAFAGGALTAAFAAVGWSWGGEWDSNRDYQHFSAGGG